MTVTGIFHFVNSLSHTVTPQITTKNNIKSIPVHTKHPSNTHTPTQPPKVVASGGRTAAATMVGCHGGSLAFWRTNTLTHVSDLQQWHTHIHETRTRTQINHPRGGRRWLVAGNVWSLAKTGLQRKLLTDQMLNGQRCYLYESSNEQRIFSSEK